MVPLSFSGVFSPEVLARFVLLVCIHVAGISGVALAQQNPAVATAGVEQLLGCWHKVSEPESRVCFKPDGKLIFTQAATDKTIRRKWKIVENGLLRIKFISLFKPKYRIQSVSETYLKLVPVKKGVVIELEREK